MKPKTWNDVLAMTFGLVILAIWTLAGTCIIELPDIVLGATISCFTLIVQFYFRKAQGEKASES
jgi:hypothetical protein